MLTTLLGWVIGLGLTVFITYAAVSPIIMVFGMLGRAFTPKPIPRKIKKSVTLTHKPAKRTPAIRRPINTRKTSIPLIELSKTTRTYDPRYKIEDLLQFGD